MKPNEICFLQEPENEDQDGYKKAREEFRKRLAGHLGVEVGELCGPDGANGILSALDDVVKQAEKPTRMGWRSDNIANEVRYVLGTIKGYLH